MKVVYLAHCVSCGTEEGVLKNCADAKAILRNMIEEYPEKCFIAPWIAEVEARIDVATGADEDVYRDALEKCKVVIDLCDEVWLTGPYVSRGMGIEKMHALSNGKLVRDLTLGGAV